MNIKKPQLLSRKRERYRGQDKLQTSAEKYRSLIQNIPDVVWTTDQKGKTVFISSGVKEAYGYTPKEIYKGGNKVWFGRIHPEDKEKVIKAYTVLFGKGFLYDIEYRIQRKDRKWIWLHDRAIRVYEKNGIKYADGLFTDVTKRKEMEEELKKNREILAGQVKQRTNQLEDTKDALLNVLADSREVSARNTAILASIADGVIVVNRSGFIILMNNEAEKLLGWTIRESVGKKWWQILKREDENGNLISPEDGAIKTALTTTTTTTTTVISSCYYVRKDGTKFPVERSVSPIILGVKTIGAVNVFRDITKRKEMEEKIKIFSKAVDGALDSFVLTDMNGNVTYANRSASRDFGYSPTEMLKLNVSQLDVNPENVAVVVEKLKAQGYWYGELIQIKKNKETFPTSLSISLVKDDKGRPTNMMGVFRDITERKKIELELRKSAEIIESSQDAIYSKDLNGIIMSWNRGAETIYGYKEKEIVGKSVEILVPERLKGELREILVKLKEGVKINSYKTKRIRKDGKEIDMFLTISPIKNESGKVIGGSMVGRDISKERELERMKDEFLDIAAHDLRTPATAVRGFISRVLEGDAGKISAKAREFLKEAYEGNLRSIHLVDDFLAVSRLERGKIKILPKPGDLVKIIDSAVREYLDLAKANGLTLEYKKIKLPLVLVDGDRIFQVLNNLIGNAIKFTQKGGITISHIITNDEVITKVTDTGVGIPLKIQNQLFRKYFKGENERVYPSGLGLGLYICKLCVEGSHGRIWVKSKKGKGSTFSFSLPIAKQE